MLHNKNLLGYLIISKLKSLFSKKRKSKIKNPKMLIKLQECSSFVGGYKCIINCNPCPFGKNGLFNNELAKINCHDYKVYYRCPADMSMEEYQWYSNLTKSEQEFYDKLYQKGS